MVLDDFKRPREPRRFSEEEKRLFTISQFEESIEAGIGCLAEVINAVAS